MIQTLKKVFSVVVSLTTIAWSVGVGTLVLPNVASAATLSAGDLIKASGPAVYYYAGDGKRYVFPNEKTYFSWFKDFSSVKTITDSELAAIQIAANVTERAGTKLVKITTDPKTYAVTPWGVLHWIESEAVAKALYGDAWAARVIDVSDAFFVNYTVGSSISTNVHPDGTLIKYAGDPTHYVVWGGMKRKLSDASIAANNLDVSNAIMTTIAYGNGSDVTSRESVLADVVGAGSMPVAGGALQVSLASDTPAGVTVTKNASSVALVKVNLTAGSAAVMLTGLHFHRVGVGSVSDFSNVYLYDGSGKRLTTGRTINTTTNIVEFNNLNVTVPAGQTWAALVYGDFSSPANTGGQHSFELVQAASVLVSGASTVSGAFPVRGNVFTVGTASSARVDVQKGILPANPNIGAQDVEISNFKVTGNTNDVSLKQVTLYQAGSVSNSDLSNFNLYQGTTLVASAASIGADGHIVLKFTTPFVIANGTTKVFSLRATVGGRAGRTIRTYVEYTTDVTAIDNVYNAGASICIEGASTPCTGSPANFDGTGSNYIEVTTQGGQLTNSFNGPTTTNIAKGQLAVPLYKFALTSPDNTLEIRKVVFTIATVTAGCKVQGSLNTNYFRSIKIKNMDTGTTVMGPQEFSGTGGATSKTVTYTDSFNINAGQTLNLALVADLSNSEDAANEFFGNGTCLYRATFSAFGSSDVRVVSTGEFLATSKIVPNSDVTGNGLTVKSSSLDVNLASTPVSGTLVKKQQNVAIAGLTLTASAQSDVTVTNITLTGQAALSGWANGFGTSAGNQNFAQRVTSLALFDGSTQVGLAKAPDTTTGAAQISNMNLLIPKGTTKQLTVQAAFSSTASSTAPYDKISVGINLRSDIQAQDQDSNTVNPTFSGNAADTGAVHNQAVGASPSVVQTILNSGTITIQADSHPVSNIVIACNQVDVANCPWVPFAQYKATAQYEDVMIDRIAVTSTAGAANADNADYRMVAIASGGAVKGSDQLPSGITGTKDIDLTVNPLTVPKDSSITFQIWVKLSNVQASGSVNGLVNGVARSGHAPGMGLMASSTGSEWSAAEYGYGTKLNVRSTGAASGERVYAAVGAANGNSMVLRKSVPVVTKQSLSSTTLANSDQDLIKFQVAADSAGSIALKQVVFTFSKSSGVTLSNFRMRRGSTDITPTSAYAITNGTSTADLTNGSIPAGVSSGYIVFAMAPGQEESISGSGNVYTLHATVSATSGAQNVSVSFLKDSSNPIVTGYINNSYGFGVFGSSSNIFNIDTQVSPSGVSSATGTFVWSDNSEVPHSSAAETSRDWTNDVYVQDLSQSQQLSGTF